MAPRNNDADTNYQNKSCPDREMDAKCALPCLMHKKHKVIKLVKSQMKEIQKEGLFNEVCRAADLNPADTRTGPSRRFMAQPLSGEIEGHARGREREAGTNRHSSFPYYLLAFFLSVILLIFLMVWVSAGPLSNSIAHTPIPSTAFVRTDSICSLEKKYLLRWSKPEYFE